MTPWPETPKVEAAKSTRVSARARSIARTTRQVCHDRAQSDKQLRAATTANLRGVRAYGRDNLPARLMTRLPLSFFCLLRTFTI